MNPEKVGLFGALITLAITALITPRDGSKQVEIHKDAEEKTNELIEALGLGGEEKSALEESVADLFLKLSAARPPSEDNCNTVQKLFDEPEDFSTGAARAAGRAARENQVSPPEKPREQQPEHPPENDPNAKPA